MISDAVHCTDVELTADARQLLTSQYLTLRSDACCGEQGKTSKEYLEIKKMAFLEPELLHAMLKSLADSIGDYANYQVRSLR